jgi:hypothetical protein
MVASGSASSSVTPPTGLHFPTYSHLLFSLCLDHVLWCNVFQRHVPPRSTASDPLL